MRLYKGSFDQKTEYSVSPSAQAGFFESEGADGIHVVDLDGARVGHPKNLRTIEKICAKVKIPVEVGGGVRTLASAEKLFAVGVARIIVGTIAVEKPKLLAKLLEKFGPEKVIVGLDAQKSGTQIATHGWETKTALSTLDFAEQLEASGVQRVIFTDIARDGTLTFPNFDVNERLVQTTNLKVVASGGVTDIAHLQILRRIGCEGAIIGKALYENELSVAEIKDSLK